MKNHAGIPWRRALTFSGGLVGRKLILPLFSLQNRPKWSKIVKNDHFGRFWRENKGKISFRPTKPPENVSARPQGIPAWFFTIIYDYFRLWPRKTGQNHDFWLLKEYFEYPRVPLGVLAFGVTLGLQKPPKTVTNHPLSALGVRGPPSAPTMPKKLTLWYQNLNLYSTVPMTGC